MTIHLHGILAGLAVILLAIGAAAILTGIDNWLRARFTVDTRPLWHVIPRRFSVHRRWDRCGGHVRLADGREGAILGTFDMDDSPGPIALVQPWDENDDPHNQCPDWVPLGTLTPLPSLTLRELWHELRGPGGSAGHGA